MKIYTLFIQFTLFKLFASISTDEPDSTDYENNVYNLIMMNFKIIQNYESSFILDLHKDFFLYGMTIHFLPPVCDIPEHPITNQTYMFENCTVTGIMNFKLNKYDNTIFTVENIIFDWDFPQINMTRENEDQLIMYLSDERTFTINKNYPFMQVGEFTDVIEKLPYMHSKLVDLYWNQINRYYTRNINSVKSEINSILNWLTLNGNYFNITEDLSKQYKVTHYKIFKYIAGLTLDMSNKAAIVTWTIRVSYSVNFNLNYSEGYILLKNVHYYHNDQHTFTYDTAEFQKKIPQHETEEKEVSDFLIQEILNRIKETIETYFSERSKFN